MAKVKTKKFVCSECGDAQLVWEGFCRSCRAVGTYKETGSVTSSKVVRQRWQRVERETARDMQNADGPDPLYKHIASSTGKVGHITGLGFDAISRTYTTEVKNRPLPAWVIVAWVQILQKSIDLKKSALLHIKPPNLPTFFKVNGESFRTPSLAIITQEQHLALVNEARILNELEELINNDPSYVNLRETIWRLRHK